MKIKILFLAHVMLLTLTNTSAQKTFDELMAGKNLETKELPRPKYFKLDMKSDGAGIFPYFPGIPPIKKIAIVSSSLIDIMHFKTKTTRRVSYNYNFTWKTTTTSTTTTKTKTDDDIVFASELGFYIAGLDAMKEVAKSKGIQLLEIEEVLTTPELKAFYENFEPEASKLGNKVGKLGKNLDQAGKGEGDGLLVIRKGYNYFDPIVYTDYKFGTSMGQLCKKLGVDAILVFNNEISATKKNTVNLMKTGVYLFGPNPVPFDPNKKYVGFGGAKYNEGHMWWGVEMGAGKEFDDGVPYIDYKAQKTNVEGYEKLPAKCLEIILEKVEATKAAFTK